MVPINIVDNAQLQYVSSSCTSIKYGHVYFNITTRNEFPVTFVYKNHNQSENQNDQKRPFYLLVFLFITEEYTGSDILTYCEGFFFLLYQVISSCVSL